VKLLLDISHMSFNVGRPFERRLDDNGVQRLDRKTRAPLWSAQLVVMSADGADTINVTIAGEPPAPATGPAGHPGGAGCDPVGPQRPRRRRVPRR